MSIHVTNTVCWAAEQVALIGRCTNAHLYSRELCVLDLVPVKQGLFLLLGQDPVFGNKDVLSDVDQEFVLRKLFYVELGHEVQ